MAEEYSDGEEELELEDATIKLVVVGDGAVGKTCLLISFTRNEFPKEYVPTVFENIHHGIDMNVNGEQSTIQLNIWDTAGQEEFDKIRVLSYRGTHVFLMCFSTVAPNSFENLRSKWMPELRHHMKDSEITILLVGNKKDLRNDSKTLASLRERGKEQVPQSQIDALVKEIGAIGYCECSALTREGVTEVFETAVRGFIGEQEKDVVKEGGCCTVL